jgi:hypothetical protein
MARMAWPQATRGRARGRGRHGFGSRALGTLEAAVEKRRGPSSDRESAWHVHEGAQQKASTHFGPINRQASLLALVRWKPTIPARRPNWLPSPSRSASTAVRVAPVRGQKPYSARHTPRRRCRRWRTSRTCWARPASPVVGRLRGSASPWPPSRSSPSAGRPGSRRRRRSPRLGSRARR